jgi:integrase
MQRKPPNTTIRHNQIWVRMYIPAEVRSCFDGKTLFLEKIGNWPIDYHQALAASAHWIAGWKRQIRKARESPDWVESMLGDDAQSANDVLEIMNETQLRNTARMFLASLKNKKIALESTAQTDTPFLFHFDEWKKRTNLKGKTLDQAASDIKQFSTAVSKPLEGLSGGDVQTWIEGLSETVSAVTVRRKLSALKSYWRWLQSHEHVSPDNRPFDGRTVNDRRTKVERAIDKRQRFEPSDIPKLIQASADDPSLQAMICLAAYTGARREGLASLTKQSVIDIEGIPSIRLQEKTEAGIRTVPIHPEIADLIADLISESEDGFLIPSDPNRYGKRGDALGKRFTRLKTSLGFDERHTFHSIRHSVVFLFRRAECPIEIRNQILGHEAGDTGAGGDYGGHIDQKHKLEWMTKAISYP